ncbi:elongin-C isoform X1 [Hermetia illucens]|uniref:elongin-C isoform X1 n=2 Tax=Hermetia illucens TaxID=343691 RepID=UPI0018CBF396|nr:elongin-C isoform X1 [Hermetia illucens]
MKGKSWQHCFGLSFETVKGQGIIISLEFCVFFGARFFQFSRSNKMSQAMDEQRSERVYGGCEGPDAMYVKLISSDGHEFIVKREHALTSGTIKAMLSGPGQFAENEANEVNFREIPSHVLQKVCMYFTYKVRYTNSSTEIPEFPIQPEIALELLMAANFLDC